MTLSHVLLGLATGLPVMAVVGPIALLLIEQGLERGLRGGWPAALGVVAADVTFATSVAVAGAAIATALAPVQGVLEASAVVLLAGLAVHQWRSARRAARRAVPTASPVVRVTFEAAAPSGVMVGSAVAAMPAAVASAEVPAPAVGATGSAPARAGGFFLVTALNPVTVVVFASIVLGAGEGAGTAGWVAGMALASLVVNLGFVTIGHLLGAVLDDRAAARARMGAAVMIAALAAHFALG